MTYSAEVRRIVEQARACYERRDWGQAFEFFLQAAESGHVGSQSFVAWMYLAGIGTSTNLEQAEYWAAMSARQGDAQGQYMMSLVCRNRGQQEPGLEWLRRAAEHKSAGALYELGKMHAIGWGVLKDRDLAFEHFRQAATQGHLRARMEMARLMLRGHRGIGSIAKGLLLALRTAKDIHEELERNPYSGRLEHIPSKILAEYERAER